MLVETLLLHFLTPGGQGMTRFACHDPPHLLEATCSLAPGKRDMACFALLARPQQHTHTYYTNIHTYTLKWFGHVERIESESLTKSVYVSEVDWERGRGRPRLIWRDGVEKYVREGGLSWGEGRQMTGDRGTWRRFVRGHPLRD